MLPRFVTLKRLLEQKAIEGVFDKEWGRLEE